MRRAAWVYLYTIFATAVTCSIWAVHTIPSAAPSWALWVVLSGLGVALALWSIPTPGRKIFDAAPVSMVAAFFLLPPGLCIIQILVQYIATWAYARWTGSPLLRSWYIQPFNIANSIISACATYWFIAWSGLTLAQPMGPLAFGMALVACLIRPVVSQCILIGVLYLARGIKSSYQETLHDIFYIELPLACMGYLAAELYMREPLLALYVLAPIGPIYRAFLVPRIQEEAMQALQEFNQELTVKNQMIQQINDELFETLAKVFDARDPYVGGHAAQVAAYAVAIGEALRLPAAQIETIRQSAYLHDIGKIAIPDAILHKTGRLTDSEYKLIQKHVEIGADFVATTQSLKDLAPFIRHHHERWDGRGYPNGLAGEAIPLEARILALCDAVEAMASDRPYHRGLSTKEIMAEVERCAGSQFDPVIAAAFIRIVTAEQSQFIVNSAQIVCNRYTNSNLKEAVSLLTQIYRMHPATS